MNYNFEKYIKKYIRRLSKIFNKYSNKTQPVRIKKSLNVTRSKEEKLSDEIGSFQNLWRGGFKTGYNKKRNQIGI